MSRTLLGADRPSFSALAVRGLKATAQWENPLAAYDLLLTATPFFREILMFSISTASEKPSAK